MGNTHKTARRSRARSLFGLDIGNGTLKVMQVEKATSKSSKSSRIIGYGTASFSKSAIDRGVIVDPEAIAHAVHHLFHTDLIGSITSHKVSMCIPAYRTFARTLTLPKTASKKLTATVSLEVEQYTLVPLEKLYVDYSLIARSKDYLEVLAMAVPRVVADSYQTLAKIMGLETALIETTSNAAVRLFAEDELSDMPAVIVDFGSLSTDINIYDKILLATSTAAGGGDVFTHAIRSKLGVTHAEGTLIKTKYGLGLSKHQREIREALEPALSKITQEIRRMIAYYDKRYGPKRPIKQIVILGGGANIPGLSEYLTDNLRLAVRPCQPWHYFSYKGLPAPSHADRSMYATVAGLSLED